MSVKPQNNGRRNQGRIRESVKHGEGIRIPTSVVLSGNHYAFSLCVCMSLSESYLLLVKWR